MSRETWEIVTSKKIEEVELQLAMQCAPLIAGLKISNLLNIRKKNFGAVVRILKGSHISWYVLLQDGDRMTILLYHEKSLNAYLRQPEAKKMLDAAGYRSMDIVDILMEFRRRYRSYMEKKQDFPHEMGLLLGYPVEDVTGFIEHKGERSLCTGYWKVYENKDKKLRIFESFENAKESLIQRLSCGTSMADIIRVCRVRMERSC